MQLFTHLLSSYLQGMGDFFSALPWGREFVPTVFEEVGWNALPLGRVGEVLEAYLIVLMLH